MKVKIDVYNTILNIKIFKTTQELLKALKRYYKKLKIQEETELECEGIIFFNPSNTDDCYLFIVEKNITINTVSHEIYHLTNRMLLYKGMVLKIEDDEEHAILNAFLNEKVIDLLIKNGYIING